MKQFTKGATILFLSAGLMTACAENGGQGFKRQDFTTVLGAISGGILGSNVGKGKGRMVGAAVGALAGAQLGHWLGDNLDPKDRTYYESSTQRALETTPVGQTVEWRNPDSGVSGNTTPLKTYKYNNRYCREYTQVIHVGGKKQEAFGKACRMPDGSWEIQKD